MKLKDVATLLGANTRFFSVVYEGFKFKEEDMLRDYIDFILHEPVEWLRGFPLKLKTGASFAKPKAALIKVLKASSVVEALGADYCKNARDVVWDTFKKHADTVLNAREKGIVEEAAPIDPIDHNATNELVDETVAENEFEEVADLPFGAPAAPVVSPWERKYRILRSVVGSMLFDYRENTGLVMAVNTLLANLDADAPSS